MTKFSFLQGHFYKGPNLDALLAAQVGDIIPGSFSVMSGNNVEKRITARYEVLSREERQYEGNETLWLRVRLVDVTKADVWDGGFRGDFFTYRPATEAELTALNEKWAGTDPGFFIAYEGGVQKCGRPFG